MSPGPTSPAPIAALGHKRLAHVGHRVNRPGTSEVRCTTRRFHGSAQWIRTRGESKSGRLIGGKSCIGHDDAMETAIYFV